MLCEIAYSETYVAGIFMSCNKRNVFVAGKCFACNVVFYSEIFIFKIYHLNIYAYINAYLKHSKIRIIFWLSFDHWEILVFIDTANIRQGLTVKTESKLLRAWESFTTTYSNFYFTSKLNPLSHG